MHTPELRGHLESKLTGFNLEAMRAIITDMTKFDIPIPLSPDRAEFVCRLTEARHQNLVHTLIT